MDNFIPAIDKKIFYGDTQVFFGALYLSHKEKFIDNMIKSIDMGIQVIIKNKI